MVQESKSFCLAPWVHAHVTASGERRLCCVSERLREGESRAPLSLDQHWNSVEMRRVRRQMVSGESVPECKTCELGEKGFNVLKNHYNQRYHDHMARAMANTIPDGSFSGRPISFDYRNATCNFKCRMCDAGNSTSWQKELIFNKIDRSAPPISQDQTYSDFISAAEKGQLEELYWAGGEPLVLPQHWQVMNQIVKIGRPQDIDVRYSTNLSRTSYQGQNIVDLVAPFRKVEFYLSLDGVGAVGEYIRTGLNWTQWQKDFEFLMARRRSNMRIVIDCTLTLPGLLDAEPFLDYFADFEVEISAKPVLTYSRCYYLAPQVLPEILYRPLIAGRIAELHEKKNALNTSFFATLESYSMMQSFEVDRREEYADIVLKAKEWCERFEKIRAASDTVTFSSLLGQQPSLTSWWNSIPGNPGQDRSWTPSLAT